MKIKTFIFGAFVALILFLIVPYFLVSLNDYLGLPIISHPILKMVGGLLGIVALLVILHSFFLFKIVGEGTPMPIEPPKKLVIKGLYKHTRNPMYLSYFALILAEFFFLGHLLLLVYLVLGVPIVHICTVFLEEPALKKRFDKDYDKYIKKVSRWLI